LLRLRGWLWCIGLGSGWVGVEGFGVWVGFGGGLGEGGDGEVEGAGYVLLDLDAAHDGESRVVRRREERSRRRLRYYLTVATMRTIPVYALARLSWSKVKRTSAVCCALSTGMFQASGSYRYIIVSDGAHVVGRLWPCASVTFERPPCLIDPPYPSASIGPTTQSLPPDQTSAIPVEIRDRH